MLLPKPGEIITSIIENNPSAVRQNLSLLLPGFLSPTIPMSPTLFNELMKNMKVDDRKQAAEILAGTLNVPALMNGPHINYLSRLQNETGKYPAQVLYDILMQESNNQEPMKNNYTSGTSTLSTVQWTILGLSLIGILTVITFVIRLIQKVFQ